MASVTGPDPDGPGPLGPPRTTFTYDSQGNVLTRVDPKGNVAGCGCAGQYTTTFAYNPAGQRLTETDPLGHTSSNAYDDAGRLVSTTDANGHTTSYAYDDANRLLTETAPDPDGAGPQGAPVTTYTYDDAGNKLTETDPRGNTTTFAYDTANRLVSTTAPDPDGAGPQPAPVTTYTYDQNANLASMVEPRGNLAGANPDDYRTTYTYDAAGRLLTTTDPLGHATTNAYDPVGNSAAVTDANGHVTSYTYDYAGRVLTVTAPDPDGAGPLTAPVTTYTYDGAGNRLTRTDTNGHITTWAYDALDRVVSETAPDPDGAGGQTPSVQTMAYDENGNLLSTTDANGNGTPTQGDGMTTYSYDRADRLTGIDYSDSTPDVSFTLDAVGNRLTMADGEGTETRTYDDLDRLLTVVRGSSSFSYTYDAAGNVTHRGALEYGFDALDRLVAVTQDGTALASYGYDAASNQVTHAYPSGYTETRTFDRAGRLASIEDTRETPGFATQTLVPGSVLEQTKLDGALADIQDDPGDPAAGLDWMTANSPRDDVALRVGFATPASAPVGLQTFRVRVRKQGGSATPTVRLDLYENGVLRASGTPATVTSSSGQLVSQSFDLDTVSLANPDGSGVELRLVGTHAGNGQARASVDVDAVAWDERFATGPLLLARLVYTRDAVGNPTQLERTGELAGRQTYTYDAMDRLTSVCFQASCPGRGDPFIRWTYDGVGNRLTEQRPSGTTAYTYDAMDRMLTAGSTSYDYDRNGNQTEAGSLSYGYDLANRLVSVSDGTTYRYDGDGVRVATTTPTGEFTALWDVNNPTPLLVSEFNLQSSESLVPTGPVSRSYVYGTSLLRQTTTIATTPPTRTTLDLFADALDSVIATSTAGAAQVETADYEPYGQLRTGSVSSVMRFTGQYHDQTGLYHLRARQYDPETGRFLAVDPADQTVGGGAISAYTYTGNRPTVMNDPSGGFSIRAGGATSITRSLMSTESAQSGYLRIHNDIVNAVGFAVWIAGRVAGVPDMAVTSDGASNAIPGASQVNDGNNGYADLILWAPRDRTALIWEFKAVGQSASRARTQISTYVDRFPRGHTGWTPRPGFRIPSTGAMRVPYRWGVADVSATLKTPIPGIEWYRRHNNSPGDRRLPQFEIPPELVVAMAIAIAAAGIKCGCDDPGLTA